MILVTVGSQKFQFNRLLKKIDELIDKKIITDSVFAQIGVSDYKPNNYEYVSFMSQDEFNQKLDECDMVITHAGTGVIVNAVKKGKKVIAVPRLKEFQEHVDNHQIQLIKEFDESHFIEPCYDLEKLSDAISKTKTRKYKKYTSNTEAIIESIKEFIEK